MNKKLLSSKIFLPALVLTLGIASLSIPTKASAAGFDIGSMLGFGHNQSTVNVRASDDNSGGSGGMMHRGMMPGVFGTVTAINGNSITITSKMWAKPATGSTTTPTQTTATYTVDATNATVTKNQATSSLSAIAVGDTIAVQGTVSGTTVTATKINDGVMPAMQRAPGVRGTVTAVSGDTITVQSKTFTKGSTTSTATSYTVNASGATVTKANAASTVSAIAVGDTVMVQGTVSGTTVTATKIEDGMMMKGAPSSSNAGATIPNSNGQPIIGGTVTAVSGNTVTISNKSNTSYTIDVTNAAITKGGTSSTVSNIAVGDSLLAQGTVNGTSVTAVNVVDSSTTTSNGTTHKGFLGAIGAFFSKLF